MKTGIFSFFFCLMMVFPGPGSPAGGEDRYIPLETAQESPSESAAGYPAFVDFVSGERIRGILYPPAETGGSGKTEKQETFSWEDTVSVKVLKWKGTKKNGDAFLFSPETVMVKTRNGETRLRSSFPASMVFDSGKGRETIYFCFYGHRKKRTGSGGTYDYDRDHPHPSAAAGIEMAEQKKEPDLNIFRFLQQ